MTKLSKLWDVATGKEIQTLNGHKDSSIESVSVPMAKLWLLAVVTKPLNFGMSLLAKKSLPSTDIAIW
jgi:WD40 repeat protein